MLTRMLQRRTRGSASNAIARCGSTSSAVHSKEMNGGEFFVDHPRLHRFIAAATEIVRESTDATVKLKRLREPYAELLGDPEWLPDEFKQPSASTTMGTELPRGCCIDRNSRIFLCRLWLLH